MPMDTDLCELVRQFKDETDERLRSLTDGILALEKAPAHAEVLQGVFRDAHTLKGNARLVGIVNAAHIAHAIEEILEMARQDEACVTEQAVGALLAAVDLLQQTMDQAAEGRVDEELSAETVAVARRLASLRAAPGAEGAGAVASVRGRRDATPMPTSQGRRGPDAVAGPQASAIVSQRVSVARLNRIAALATELTSESTKAAALLERLGALRQLCKASRARRDPGLVPPNAGAEELERMWQLSRLCLSDLTTIAATADELFRDYEAHTRATTGRVGELARIATESRLLPVRDLFLGLRRTARDLGTELGKDVELAIEGEETPVEKRIIDELRLPLQHMLRNAIDHGVEDPATRRAAGKTATAKIILRAYPRGDHVVVEVEDDGRGLDPSELERVALERGLMSREQLGRMLERELLLLIFEPGFSTRAAVTDVSGRGVGLDAVQDCVTRLDGRIRVTSTLGAGTLIAIELPLNLSVVRALIVAVGELRFAIPTSVILQVARLERGQRGRVGTADTVVLDGMALPVLDLAAHCGLSRSAARSGDLWTVVVGHGGRRVACVVDEIVTEERVAIAPLGRFFADLPTASAATILGDGSVAVLLQSEGMLAAVGMGTPATMAVDETAAREAVSVLVVDDSRNTRELLRSVLEGAGHVVDLADNGVDGLEKARAQPYDLIITDVEMPVMDGFELTARLRADERYLRTPIIVVTTRDTPADRRRGLSAGATAYFIKAAFDQNAFLDVVRKAVA